MSAKLTFETLKLKAMLLNAAEAKEQMLKCMELEASHATVAYLDDLQNAFEKYKSAEEDVKRQYGLVEALTINVYGVEEYLKILQSISNK